MCSGCGVTGVDSNERKEKGTKGMKERELGFHSHNLSLDPRDLRK